MGYAEICRMLSFYNIIIHFFCCWVLFLFLDFLFIHLFFSRVEKDIYYHLRQRHVGHHLGNHHRSYRS